MAEELEQHLAKVEVTAATAAEQTVLANLLELYVYDFSGLIDVELGEDGRFGYPDLEHFWSDANRYPFLVRVDGKLAGFVLVQRCQGVADSRETVWDIAEFFVVRRYRRLGVGAVIAKDVWERFPGSWEVRVRGTNLAAMRFWERAVAEFVGESVASSAFDVDGVGWQLFRFESGSRKR